MQGVWIGTSGWVYKHWAESFYPEGWRKAEEFQFYATQFPTVEINATFYRLPSEAMVKGWNQKAPEGFLFAAKGSRYITHMKKLKDVDDALKVYFDRIKFLKNRLGPILWQLPPNLGKDLPRLDAFLSQLPAKYQHAVEFRHPSWIGDDTFTILRQHNVANVWLSSQRMPMDFTVTADFVYLRFHGLELGAAHDYTEGELKPWAEQLVKSGNSGKSAFVYFNNDWNTRAPLNAKLLMKMVGELAIPVFSKQSEAPAPRSRIRKNIKSSFNVPRSKRLTEK